ncbi:J domain-containing protein [Ramlibacter alkalitolerans]|uniref:J domain-containing protein n=1 Tax=Ramlibacter alkalitolerans TaxID=2039631 RepID=A0ABS1JLF0_9BURK|nr:J domain-containing protein [Ramlibacter alkalitolerans]MBL0425069.1 J domain-containing protein [Ramlibacter alkalitolerans]
MAASTPTYYDVLQVERTASPERVRAAYRKLAHKYHPDKMPGNANATRAMAAINTAYEVLADAQRRAEHDLWIQRMERGPQVRRAAQPAPNALTRLLRSNDSWPWYLLFGTMSVALGTIGTAVYLAAMPARATAAPQPCAISASAQPAECPRRS